MAADLANLLNKPQITGKSAWIGYMNRIYASRKGPEPLGTVVYDEIEARAKEIMKDHSEAFMYAGGSAGRLDTVRGNARAFEKYRIIPRMLVNATVRDLEVTLFGVKYSSPLFIAPIGVQGIFYEEGELAPARAGQKLGVPFIMSTASSRSIEAIAEANGDGQRWYQLYWPRTNEVTLSILGRAKAAGFTALVVTLDTMTIGWRPHDLPTAYIPFTHGIGVEVGRSDPVFMGRLGKTPVPNNQAPYPYVPKDVDDRFRAQDPTAQEEVQIGVAWLQEANSGLFRTWEDLKFLRDNWEGPLILKGIQSVQDAEKCLDHGVDGFIVSNHGGRQVDGAIPSLYALANIMASSKIKDAQTSGKLTVLFDSGIRNGPDIFKAIALGAQGILLGRPWLYGAVIAGQAGIEQVITHTLADFDNTLGLAGYQSVEELRGSAAESLQKVDF